MFPDPVLEDAFWATLVSDVCRNDELAVERLYALLSEHVRPALGHVVGPQWLDDFVHEVLVIVLETIRAGELREPSRLMGFVHRIAQRKAVAHIRQAVFLRRRQASQDCSEATAPRSDSPDSGVHQDDRLRRMTQVLRRLSPRDREIVERFYLLEQPREQICLEMHLTETQFRLFKSRAIARCSSSEGPSLPVRSVSRIA